MSSTEPTPGASSRGFGYAPRATAPPPPDDIAAEAWLVAATKIADFHGTSSDFAGWLFGIARNTSIRAKEKSDRRRTHPGDVDLYTPAAPDPTLAIDDRFWLRHTLESLPARERDVIGLIDGLGMDNQSAGEALGISTVAVRVARHRGLRRLNRLIGTREETLSVT